MLKLSTESAVAETGRRDPSWINKAYHKKRRFPFIIRATPSFIYGRDSSPEDVLWKLHPVIDVRTSKNGRIPVSRNKPIGLMK